MPVTTKSAANAENSRILRGILEAVSKRNDFSQRELARELGIALGLTNIYLKRCVRMGFLKVSHVPARRYGYYLTTEGFAEKTRLTVEYLSKSLSFFRQAKADCADTLNKATELGWSKVALAGVSDVTEIMALCVLDSELEVIGVIDPARAGEKFFKWHVLADYEDLPTSVDGILITKVLDDAGFAAKIQQAAGTQSVLTPNLLSIQTHEADHA